jgi:inosose dehydratase
LKQNFNRREFTRTVAMSVAAAALSPSLPAAKERKIHIGHTGITWPNSEIARAIANVGSEGFYGFETFGEVFDKWEEQPGGFGRRVAGSSIAVNFGLLRHESDRFNKA